MENLRILKGAIIAFVTMYLLLPGPSTAYDQVKTHPEINDLAFERFVRDWMPNDASLKNCSMDRDKILSGPAWDQDMGNSRLGEIPNQIRTKNVKDWLKSGGFSADMPEIPKGVRHYYAPHAKDPYITDLKAEFDALNTFKAVCLGGTGAATAVAGPVAGLAVTGVCSVIYGGFKFIVNWQGASEDINAILQKGVLGISNIDWAFDPDNPYSFSKAKEYDKDALGLTDSSADSQYSKACRGVGETMHLISDLTVPAHTRNDGHGIQEDPYEEFAKWSNVMKYSDPTLFTFSSDLDYRRKTPEKDLKAFMKDVATWTSENFFSRDTITKKGQTTTDNSQPAFSSPNLDQIYVKNDNTYYYNYISTTDGYGQSKAYRTELAHKPWTLMVWKDAKLELDNKVLAAQASFLIPTAIEASSAVLDAFLPRFIVNIDDVSKDPDDETKYVVKGSLEHIPTEVWPEKLAVRNGGGIKITRKDGTKDFVGVPYMGGDVKWTGKLEPDDVIVLEFNLGGYVISSKPHALKKAEIDCDSIDLSKLKKVSEQNREYYIDDKGVMQGPSIFYYDDAHKKISSKGCLLNGMKTGQWVIYYEKGNKSEEGCYKDGKENGYWVSYHEGGTKSWEGYKADGKQTGHCVTYYHPDHGGKIESEGDYKDDKKIGLHIVYDAMGRKYYEVDYKDGNQETIHWIFYIEGRKYKEGDYNKYGKKTGRWIFYDSNEVKVGEENCVDDVCSPVE